MDPIYRFYRPDDAEQVNLLAHIVFGLAPFTAAVWQQMEDHDHATVIAEENGRIIGAIPFDLRDFLIRPGLSVRAAFAHMVCVDEAYRAKGIGSGMMRFAKNNLPQLCEGMFVYTGSEGVQPYTFYQKNGFIDLHYSRFWQLANPGDQIPQPIQVGPFDPEKITEAALNDCYQRAYGPFAGFPIHAPGFWRKTIDGIIYAEIPTEFFCAEARRGTQLDGYAIYGISADGCIILELAADPAMPALAAALIQAAAADAAQRGVNEIQILASTHHPAIADLAALGFRCGLRSDSAVTAGMVFDFAALWQRLTANQAPFGLEIWTPTRTVSLPGPGPAVRLEMKEATLHRLFLCRENFQVAWESEAITSPEATVPFSQLSAIFQPARWVFHWFEWI